MEMPVDVAMQEPRAGVVGDETDGDVICSVTRAHNVAHRRVSEVVAGLAGAADDGEGVLMREFN